MLSTCRLKLTELHALHDAACMHCTSLAISQACPGLDLSIPIMMGVFDKPLLIKLIHYEFIRQELSQLQPRMHVRMRPHSLVSTGLGASA